jgi:ribosomal protein S18 acetylase RimI-like enzyme
MNNRPEQSADAAYLLRLATAADEPFLWDMLFYAARMEQDGATSPAAAQAHPFLAPYVERWGRPGDLGLLALDPADRQPAGAAWLRLLGGSALHEPGGDDRVPELAIAVHPRAQGRGLGTLLLAELLRLARGHYPAIVLSVREDNPACRLYQRHGFEITETVVNRVGGKSLVMQYTFSPD